MALQIKAGKQMSVKCLTNMCHLSLEMHVNYLKGAKLCIPKPHFLTLITHTRPTLSTWGVRAKGKSNSYKVNLEITRRAAMCHSMTL